MEGREESGREAEEGDPEVCLGGISGDHCLSHTWLTIGKNKSAKGTL